MQFELSLGMKSKDFRAVSPTNYPVWLPGSGVSRSTGAYVDGELTLFGWTLGCDTAQPAGSGLTMFVHANASGNRLVDFCFDEKSGESRTL